MKKKSGITILELLIALAILGVVAGIGVMNGRRAAQVQSARGAVATFQQSVWQGATAAASRGLTVELNRTDAGLALVASDGRIVREYELPEEVDISADNPILRFLPPGKVDLSTLDRLDDLVIDTGYGSYSVEISLIGEVRSVSLGGN